MNEPAIIMPEQSFGSQQLRLELLERLYRHYRRAAFVLAFAVTVGSSWMIFFDPTAGAAPWLQWSGGIFSAVVVSYVAAPFAIRVYRHFKPAFIIVPKRR